MLKSNLKDTYLPMLCTIITPDFIDRAFALFHSLRELNASFKFVVLVTAPPCPKTTAFETIFLEKLVETDRRAALVAGKYSSNSDALRWSLKPILLLHLLELHPNAKVLYSDPDTCYFKDPSEILQDMEGILLTPHWRTLNPAISSTEFRTNFLDGHFNAGCVGASIKGVPALEWWAVACVHACEHNYSEGLYADQRYLDLIPIHFPFVTVCRDHSYNVAIWNRTFRRDNRLASVGMVHFTDATIRSIKDGEDPVLEPYLETYMSYREMGKRYVESQGYALQSAKTQPVHLLFHIEEAAAHKAQRKMSIAAENAAHAFVLQLQQSRFRLLIVDYDSLFGRYSSIPPSVPDEHSVAILSSLIDAGLILAVVSRRGTRMSEQLRSAFSPTQHGAIWSCCYGGTVVERLDRRCAAPQSHDECLRIWEDLREILPENELLMNTHLSAGEQLALRVRSPHVADCIVQMLHQELARHNIPRAHISVTPEQGGIFLILRDSAIDDISTECGKFDVSEVLRIGTFGEELGLDHLLLRNGLALSCGTVSLSLRAGWNLFPQCSLPRETAYRYLNALEPTKEGILFRIN